MRRINILLQQVALAGRGRRKMHICNCTGQLAVHFLRIRRIFIAGTQTSLHMAYRNLCIEGCQSASKGRRGVTMYKHHIRLSLFHNRLQAHQRTRSHIVQRLAGGHNVQIIVRLNTEQVEHLIQHFAMLCSNSNNRLDIFRILAHCQHQRTHFNSFRTSSENSH